MNKVEQDFMSKAIIKAGVILFTRQNAMLFIEACKKEKIDILGIDAFFLIEDKIQPSLENSIDYSSNDFKQDSENIYSKATHFLNEKDEKMFFEIVCSS